MTVRKFKTCACGHADSFHEAGKKRGRCLYGSDRSTLGTTVAQCTCAKFHRRASPAAVYLEAEPASSPATSTPVHAALAAGEPKVLAALDIIITGFQQLRAALPLRMPTMPLIDAMAFRPEPVVKYPATPAAPKTKTMPVRAPIPRPASNVKLGKCELALLNALAPRASEPTTDAQLSILSGYSVNSSSFDKGLSILRTNDLVVGRRDDLRITPEGALYVPDAPPAPTGTQLLEAWCAKIAKADRAVLRVLWDAYPDELPKEEIGDRAGYSATSSSLDKALSNLRTAALARQGTGRGTTRLGHALASAR